MADQNNNPVNPDRGNQDIGIGRDQGNETGRKGTGTERERGTVQEPGQGDTGTQPDRGQGGGIGGGSERGRTGTGM